MRTRRLSGRSGIFASNGRASSCVTVVDATDARSRGVPVLPSSPLQQLKLLQVVQIQFQMQVQMPLWPQPLLLRLKP